MVNKPKPDLNPNPNLIVFAVGLIVFSLGLALIYIPAGLVGLGVVLMLISLFGERSNPQ